MKAKTYAFALLSTLAFSTAALAQEEPGIEGTPEATESAAEPTAPLQRNSPADDPNAPENPSATTTAPAATDTAWINDQKIEQFANAYMEVRTIQTNAAAQLQTANDPAKADEVKSSAETAMIAAVERSGLQVDEFNRIVQAAASDEGVRSRLDAKLQERSTGPTPGSTQQQ